MIKYVVTCEKCGRESIDGTQRTEFHRFEFGMNTPEGKKSDKCGMYGPGKKYDFCCLECAIKWIEHYREKWNNAKHATD